METLRHLRLKSISASFLQAAGCAAIATEVRCPASRFRTDVAGFADPLNSRSPRAATIRGSGYSFRIAGKSTTVLIECKQSRSDFLRDSRRLESLLSQRRALDTRRRQLEERLIKPAEPHLLGSGSMLFPELEEWDFAASRSPGYRAVLRDLRRIDQQIHGDTKFWMMARYAVADILLLAAPARIIRASELPPGWGLLEFPEEWLDSEEPEASSERPLRVRIRRPSGPAPLTREGNRVRLLRNIAVAACGRRPAMAIASVQAQLVGPDDPG